MSKPVVHFLGADEQISCSINSEIKYNIHYTIDVTRVTCKNCIRTKQYKEALENLKGKEEKVMPIEKSYEERQNEWIKENDIKVGDIVRVTHKATDNEYGWCNVWASDMNPTVGKEFRVSPDQDYRYGIALDTENFIGEDYQYPYFVLEKVVSKKESTPVEEKPIEATPPKAQTIDLMKYLEETCGEGWVHTIIDNGDAGYLVVSEATWQDKPYFNLHLLSYDRTVIDTIVVDGEASIKMLVKILTEGLNKNEGS